MCSSTFSTAAASMRGPCTTPSSRPFPTFIALTACPSLAVNSSYTPSWTSSRFAHTQVWPMLRNFDATAPSTAAPRSASSKTMKGALPPSSRLTFFTVPAHCPISCLPIPVEPVKLNLRTTGFEVISRPISDDLPVITLNTPAGTPARSASSARARAESGVAVAGLTTIGHPAARAGPALRVIMAAGKFHGVTAAVTPTGSRVTTIRQSGFGAGMVSP